MSFFNGTENWSVLFIVFWVVLGLRHYVLIVYDGDLFLYHYQHWQNLITFSELPYTKVTEKSFTIVLSKHTVYLMEESVISVICRPSRLVVVFVFP